MENRLLHTTCLFQACKPVLSSAEQSGTIQAMYYIAYAAGVSTLYFVFKESCRRRGTQICTLEENMRDLYVKVAGIEGALKSTRFVR